MVADRLLPAKPSREITTSGTSVVRMGNAAESSTCRPDGAPEEALPSPAEHKNLQAMTAAYLRSRGWVFAGGVAVCVAVLAYLLRTVNKPKTREKVRGWFGGGRPVTDQGEPPPAASPEPSPASTAQPSSLPQRFY